jgi:hypothetical protein
MSISNLHTSSRDIWSHGNGRPLRDLLASSLSTLLLMGGGEKPVYVSSPWMSDFVLFENSYREYEALFPDLADHYEIMFSSYLARLSRKLPVRLITTKNDISEAFLNSLKNVRGAVFFQYRFADGDYHEKGLLAPSFYIEGSMNFTYSGVYVRGEKVTYHCALGEYGIKKVLGAYLEFNRRWKLLGGEE